jgi:hypothetical protein
MGCLMKRTPQRLGFERELSVEEAETILKIAGPALPGLDDGLGRDCRIEIQISAKGRRPYSITAGAAIIAEAFRRLGTESRAGRRGESVPSAALFGESYAPRHMTVERAEGLCETDPFLRKLFSPGAVSAQLGEVPPEPIPPRIVVDDLGQPRKVEDNPDAIARELGADAAIRKTR